MQTLSVFVFLLVALGAGASSMTNIKLPPNCGNIGFVAAQRDDCAATLQYWLESSDAQGRTSLESGSKYCRSYWSPISGNGCVLRICRSPDTKQWCSPGEDTSLFFGCHRNPTIAELEALDVASLVISYCMNSGSGQGKVTVGIKDESGQSNEVDIMMAGINTSRRRGLLSVLNDIDSKRDEHGQVTLGMTNKFTQSIVDAAIKSRSLVENPPDVNTYVDNGYICIRRTDAPYLLRRESWLIADGGDLTDEDVVDELNDALIAEVGRIATQGGTQAIAETNIPINNRGHRAVMAMMRTDTGDSRYFGDIGNPEVNTGDPFYETLLADAGMAMTNELDIPATRNLVFAWFGIYRMGENNNQNPSTGLKRIGTIAFAAPH